MHPIYIAPTLAGLIVAVAVTLRLKRRCSLLASAIVAAMAGAIVWYVALFAIVIAIGMRGLGA